jgi:hypothetical protein
LLLTRLLLGYEVACEIGAELFIGVIYLLDPWPHYMK